MTTINNANLAKIASNQDLSDRYQVGAGILINSPGYNAKRVYQVVRNDGHSIRCDGGDGLPFTLDVQNIRWYEAQGKIQIVKEQKCQK